MIGSNNTISVFRFVEVSGKKTYSPAATFSGIACYIQQASAEAGVAYEDNIAFNLYKCITEDDYDIRIGDKIVDEQNNTYIAQAVQRLSNNEDVENHTEMILAKKLIV